MTHARPVPPMPQARPKASAPEASALEACLLYASARLERPLTLAGLQSAQARGDGVTTIVDMIAAAKRAGLQAAFGQRDLASFDPSLTPAILLLANERAVVLVAVHTDGRLVIHDPALGEGLGDIARAALAPAYTGYALLLRACHRDDIAAQHQQGHWFWISLATNRWAYSQVLLAAVLANVLSLSTSLFIMLVYDRVLPHDAIESLIALTIGVGIALVFDFVLKSLRANFIDSAGHRVDQIIGARIFDQILDLKMQARKASTGALAATLREFESLRDIFTSATLVAVVDLPFILLFLSVIYFIAGPLVIVPAIAVLCVLILGLTVQPLLARLAERNFKEGQSKQAILVETVTGIETIKTIGAQRQMRARWQAALARHADHGVRSRAIMQLTMNATGFAQQAAQVMVVFFGVFLISAGAISAGALIGAVILTGRALAPLGQLAQTLLRCNQARSAYRALDTLMQAEIERPIGKTWMRWPQPKGAIRFDHVSFAYPDQSGQALSEVSFTIKPREKVAILGPVGSGKSTVARLIAGLCQPRTGRIQIDGIDLCQIDPAELRRNLGVVLQENWLLSGTVRENIALGAVRASDADILRAARLAGVDDFIRNTVTGYATLLSERGEGLSGGQKQAIALARAFVGCPPVLLLDEPTANLDAQSEARLIARLQLELADRTLVIITHRPALLQLVDRVILLDQGRLVHDGPKVAKSMSQG